MMLMMFYGRECPHCHAMMPLVERLEREEGLSFEKLEVWHDEENAKRIRALADVIKPACGGELGVPAFYDQRRGAALCGKQPYNVLREWALSGLKMKPEFENVNKGGEYSGVETSSGKG